MDDLSTRPFAYQQKVADCRVLYLAFGGRHHDHIQREMRALGHSFSRRSLYARNDRGKHVPGWPERFGWLPKGEGFRVGSCNFVVPPEEITTKQHEPTPNNAETFLTWLKRVSPTMTWDWKYQQYVYKKLKRVTDGLCKRLMIFMPPRHGKSELVTQRYAAWRLRRDPKMRVVVASYNQKLANRFSRGIKRILHHDAVISATENTENTEANTPNKLKPYSLHNAATCPGCIARAHECPGIREAQTPNISASSSSVPSVANRRVNTESEWETREGGGVRAVGVGAGITGFGADLVIIDDPVKGHAQAESATSRENVWEWFNSDIYTRLEPNGAIILIQTRWHEDDLAGRLLREMREDDDAEQWEVIDLPALAEADFTTEAQR
jgi:hypothetical protein